MASAEEIQRAIDQSIQDLETRLTQQFSDYVQQKIDEQGGKIGTMVKTGADMVEQLGTQTAFLTKEAKDAQERASSILTMLNMEAAKLESNQNYLGAHVEELKKNTSDTLHSMMTNFNTEAEKQQQEIERVKGVVNAVASDGAERLEKKHLRSVLVVGAIHGRSEGQD